MRTHEMKQTCNPSPRNKLIAMVHIAAQHLDIEYDSAEYRAWLDKLSGKTSCKDLTNREFRQIRTYLKNTVNPALISYENIF